MLDLRPSAAPAKGRRGRCGDRHDGRPRGYFGLPRDVVLLDGKAPADISPGVPAAWHAKLKLTDGTPRPIIAEFNQERIVARPWPLKDNHMTIAELTN